MSTREERQALADAYAKIDRMDDLLDALAEALREALSYLRSCEQGNVAPDCTTGVGYTNASAILARYDGGPE